MTGTSWVPSGRGGFGFRQWARLIFSIALVGWIVKKVDWIEFGRVVRDTDLRFLTVSLAVSPLLVLISAWKWWILLRARGAAPGIGRCFHLYLVGYFFNNFLPTNVGGDVVRGYLLGRDTGRTADAMASVFLERFTGITALVAMGILAVPLTPAEFYDWRVRWSLIGVSLAYVAVLWAVLDRRVLRTTRSLERLPLVGKLVRLQEAIHLYRSDRRTLVACLLLSVLFYAMAAVNVMVSANAFGAHLTLLQSVLITPVVLMIALLPFTLGGLGLMEWAYVFTMGICGFSPAVGLSTALLMRVKNILLGAIGGIGHATAGMWPRRGGSSAPVAAPSIEKSIQ